MVFTHLGDADMLSTIKEGLFVCTHLCALSHHTQVHQSRAPTGPSPSCPMPPSAATRAWPIDHNLYLGAMVGT